MSGVTFTGTVVGGITASGSISGLPPTTTPLSVNYTVLGSGGVYEALNGQGVVVFGGPNNAGGVSGTDAGAVSAAAMNACPQGGTIVFNGDFPLDNDVVFPKGFCMFAYGATFHWNGPLADGHFLFRCNTQVAGLEISGGTYLTTYTDVYPFDFNCAHGFARDITINHTMFGVFSDFNFYHTTQLGQYGSAGHDFGINITGQSVIVDGWYADLATPYQGGFVINYPNGTTNAPDDIHWRDIHVRGVFGDFIHQYVPKSNTTPTPYVCGRFTVNGYRLEYTAPPVWSDFASFAWFDTEGIAGTYSGDFGKWEISGGYIKGPSTSMAGTNGIGFATLSDFETSGLNPNIDVLFDEVEIQGMESKGTSDLLCDNTQNGNIRLKGIKYVGAWDVQVVAKMGNLNCSMEGSNLQVGSHAIQFSTGATGASYLQLFDNITSNNISVFQNETAILVVNTHGNKLPVVNGAGSGGVAFIYGSS